MTAVSQSYPNYLGGLNEQPDELKKPGQLVEALNVIPDPVIGLTRRPGFKLIPWTNAGTGDIIQDDDIDIDPAGTWFEMELENQVNEDYIYFGCVNKNGEVYVFNQNGELQVVKYTDVSIAPHQKYEYNGNKLFIIDDNDEVTEVEVKNPTEPGGPINEHILGYFKHNDDYPLKYCVSKNHIIFTNPTQVPSLDGRTVPTTEEENKYYSFVNLKVIDTDNYNYTFKVFSEGVDTYRYITDIELDSIDDILGDYDKDLTLPLQTEGPFQFTLPNDEDAIVEVTFVGQVVQLKSSDGDGFRNEARYTWSTKLITAGKGFRKGEIYRETLNGVNGNPDLRLTFKIGDVNTVTGTENVEIVPGDVANKDADEILLALAQGFKSTGGLDTAVVTGNGIYLEHSQPFSVSTSEIAVADVMNSQKIDNDVAPIVRVNTVAELPVECYAGFIVQVSNSFSNENDYYLEYKAESESNDLDVTKSDGYWEEIKKPFEVYNPENTTLPHMITVARERRQDRFAFIVSPIEYKKRSAGTAKDNPSMFEDASPITEVNYYKNRLFFFTKIGTIISSRAGEIDNLFLNTAISVSLIDPIDIIANSNQRVPIHGSAVINNGMVLFGSTEQYSLTTANDVLTSETASVTKISNYTYSPQSDPVYLGTNIGFVSSGLTRFYEMTNVYDRGPVDINERSQQIQSQFGFGFNKPVSSREQSMVLIYQQYKAKQDQKRSREMYMYRFRQENSQDSSQTSWVKWDFKHPIAYVSMPKNNIFMVVDDLDPVTNQSYLRLYKMDSSSIEGLPADSSSVSNNLVPIYLDGYYYDDDGNVQGDPFETRIVFPTIYAQSKGANPLSDVTANLTIHRVKMSTAAIGTYDLKIERKGYDTYNILVEQTPADEYSTEFPTLYGEKVETVPVYTRNKNLTLTMSTSYDAPLTLQSMTWEGDWNRPYYKSV